MIPETKEYTVNLIEKNQLIITEKEDDNLCNNAVILTDFLSPWDSEKPSKNHIQVA